MKYITPTFNKIGRLTILDVPEKRKKVGKNKVSRVFLKCCCECGNEKWIRKDYIYNGKTQSCGCLRKDLAIEKGKNQRTEDGYLNFLYGEKRRYAKFKNLNYEITFDEFSSLVQKECHYCGDKPKLHEGVSHNQVGIKIPINGIDRIDSSKGYSIENSVPCCSRCNSMKMSEPKDLFLKKIKEIYEHSLNKDTGVIND